MRPKKKLVYFSTDEIDLSVNAFVLQNAGYNVLRATTTSATLALFSENRIDLVILDVGKYYFTTNEITRRVKAIDPNAKVLLLGEKKDDFVHNADAMLSKINLSSADFIRRVKVLSCRKRGPRKGFIPIQKAPVA